MWARVRISRETEEEIHPMAEINCSWGRGEFSTWLLSGISYIAFTQHIMLSDRKVKHMDGWDQIIRHYDRWKSILESIVSLFTLFFIVMSDELRSDQNTSLFCLHGHCQLESKA